MKIAMVFLWGAFATLLCGCESAGWSDEAFSKLFTPGVRADTRERTWTKTASRTRKKSKASQRICTTPKPPAFKNSWRGRTGADTGAD